MPGGCGRVDVRERGAQHRRERLGGRGHHLDQVLDRRRLVLDAVGVVGRVAEQRVRQLELAAQDGLGPGGLGDGGDAARREPADLGARC